MSLNERNRTSGEYDPQLELLRQIDSNVRDLGGKVATLTQDTAREFRDVNVRLSAGEVRFAQQDGRMDLIEAEQKNCAAMVETSVRKVLKEQRETDRIERDRSKGRESDDGERDADRERLSVGAIAKILGAIAAAAAIVIGAYFAGQSRTAPAPTAQQASTTQQGGN